jgi:glycosyltransferase involved in cell wall biosynthesis
MIRVLLINQDKIPHYRIPVYGHLTTYLESYGFELIVASAGIQSGNTQLIEFQYAEIPLSVINLLRFILKQKIDIIIFWVNLKYLYLFPTYVISKIILRKKIIYWGHGRDLLDNEARIKNLAYAAQHAMCDAIILYAEHLKKHVVHRFHKKVFVANNTLCMSYNGLKAGATKDSVLAEYGIYTKKNIICVGRMQKRKRIEHLVEALTYMKRSDVGLILVGPDPDGVLNEIEGDNIYKLGPIYGDKKFDLLSSADVYSIPGALGLSIVDAFYCGLPIVTESGDQSPEVTYLKDGTNGFIVPRDDVHQLASKLQLLLDDDLLREQFSIEAIKEINTNGHIDKMSKGFSEALIFVCNKQAI